MGGKYYVFGDLYLDQRMCVEYIGIFYSPCNNTFICIALCLNPLNINTVIIDTWYEYEYKLYKITVQVLISLVVVRYQPREAWKIEYITVIINWWNRDIMRFVFPDNLTL